jgi:hypothetical protein
MNNVITSDDSLDDALYNFKEVIKSNKFWADTWAISTIERLLNIKVVILSSQNYKNNDLDNVLLCGQLNDGVLEKKGFFNPSHYILIEYTGDHYKLIKYNEIGALTYLELPDLIKQLIKELCLESKSGPYYLIKEFSDMLIQLNQVLMNNIKLNQN